MKLHKKLMKLEGVRAALCWLGACYIRFVYATNRWTVIGSENPETFWRGNRPFILTFWHGRLLMTPYCWDWSRPIHMLRSEHGDGALIAQLSAHFGVETIVGSSSRGGAKAVREIVKTLNEGKSSGLTPDGPRGPRMNAQEGIVTIARLSGVPIIPMAYGTSRGKVLGSWDRFLLALPFGRGVFVWGEPITVPRDADDKAQAAALFQIEASLNDLTRQADLATGRVPVEPDHSISVGSGS